MNQLILNWTDRQNPIVLPDWFKTESETVKRIQETYFEALLVLNKKEPEDEWCSQSKSHWN